MLELVRPASDVLDCRTAHIACKTGGEDTEELPIRGDRGACCSMCGESVAIDGSEPLLTRVLLGHE